MKVFRAHHGDPAAPMTVRRPGLLSTVRASSRSIRESTMAIWNGGEAARLCYFEVMSCVRGKVVSGRADFGHWIERLSSFYEEKTGMRLYPGTLNVELSSPYSLPTDVVRLEANEYGGSVSVSIVPCRIFDRRAFLLRTDQNERGTGHHPRNIIEIATDIRLRDTYHLRDGDWVEVEFP